MRLSRNARLIITKLLFYDTLPACRAERANGVQDAHLLAARIELVKPHPVLGDAGRCASSFIGLMSTTRYECRQGQVAAISPPPPLDKECDGPSADAGGQSSHCQAWQRRRPRLWKMLR